MEASKVEIQASLINLYHSQAPGLERPFKVGKGNYWLQCEVMIFP